MEFNFISLEEFSSANKGYKVIKNIDGTISIQEKYTKKIIDFEGAEKFNFLAFTKKTVFLNWGNIIKGYKLCPYPKPTNHLIKETPLWEFFLEEQTSFYKNVFI